MTTRIRNSLALTSLLFQLVLVSACAVDPTAPERDVDESSGIRDEVLQKEIASFLQEHPSATQISDHEVAWNNGTVVMDFRDDHQPSSEVDSSGASDESATAEFALSKSQRHGCPAGWYCVYQHEKFGERRLQFSDCAAAGYTNDLRDYGFDHDVTSWVNDKPSGRVRVYDSSWSLIFTMGAQSLSSNVGPAANDRARYLVCYTQ